MTVEGSVTSAVARVRAGILEAPRVAMLRGRIEACARMLLQYQVQQARKD
jgi:hypothetical protein